MGDGDSRIRVYIDEGQKCPRVEGPRRRVVGRETVRHRLCIVVIAPRDELKLYSALPYPILLKMGLDLEYPKVWGTWLLIARKRRRGPVVYDSSGIIVDILGLRGFVVFEYSRLSKFWEAVIYFPLENNNSLLIVYAIRVMNVR
jgi:hypothetical protein